MPRTRKRKPDYRKTSGGAGRGGKFPDKALLPSAFGPVHKWAESQRSYFEGKMPNGWMYDAVMPDGTHVTRPGTPQEYAETQLQIINAALSPATMDALRSKGVEIRLESMKYQAPGVAGFYDPYSNQIVLPSGQRKISDGVLTHEAGHAFAMAGRTRFVSSKDHRDDFRRAVDNDLYNIRQKGTPEEKEYAFKTMSYYTDSGHYGGPNGPIRNKYEEMFAETFTKIHQAERADRISHATAAPSNRIPEVLRGMTVVHTTLSARWKEHFPETWKVVEQAINDAKLKP